MIVEFLSAAAATRHIGDSIVALDISQGTRYISQSANRPISSEDGIIVMIRNVYVSYQRLSFPCVFRCTAAFAKEREEECPQDFSVLALSAILDESRQT